MKMNKTYKLSLAVITALSLSATSVAANDKSEIEALKKEIAELRAVTQQFMNQAKENKNESDEKLAIIEETQQILIDETSNLKTGFEYTNASDSKSYTGLGKAASKVYNSKSPLSIGGYGKIDYYHNSNEGATNTDNIDVYRFIPYIGYKFSDNIIMNAEIEFEHGGIDDKDDETKQDYTNSGYAKIEFLYLDFLINESFNVRLGNQLMPMGLINEKHEPTLFTTVQRPNTSKKLIPSTWHENGVMTYGNLTDNLEYKLGLFSGLQLDRGIGEEDDWLRDSRIGSFRLKSGERLELATSARLDYTGINGLMVGASIYIDSNLVMGDIHFDYQKEAFRIYGVYTETHRSKTIVDEQEKAPEKAKGGFINLGYDISSLTKTQNKMPVFIQYESIAPQDKITNGTGKDSTDTVTVGVNYFPHEQVVLKADYAMSKDNSKASDVDETDTFSLSMGFIF